MKKINKIIIKRWINGKLVSTKEKIVCGYCESGEVYNIKKEGVIFCRKCGKKSKLLNKEK